MKTDKNSQITQSGTPAQIQQTVPDNNHSDANQAVPGTQTLNKYEVELGLTQYSSARVIIEAASLSEAEEKAAELEPEEIAEWNPMDGDMSMLTISSLDEDNLKPAEEGKSHE